MSTIGADFAAVYTMRKLHKEKMKKEQAMEGMVANEKKNKSFGSGCFFPVSRKTHPAKVSSVDVEQKQVKEQEEWKLVFLE